MKKNILVTGSKGQLGSELKELASDYPDHEFFFTSREDLDICNKKALKEFVTSNQIETIVNCAAYTAVDKAESEPKLADEINHLAVKSLAEISVEKNLRLIHISTDYVFNGKGFRPYPTDHPTDPLNVYGNTKLAGEKALITVNPKNSMIIRTSWVYSSFGNNFVKTMLRLGKERKELNVICDQVGAPTYARDLARFILSRGLKVKTNQVAVYHFSNEGVCSWYDFAREIMADAGLECEVNPIQTTAYPTLAKRPYYSLMDKSRITTELNYNIPNWKDSLKICIQKLKETSVRLNS
ncbi:dTDP-4-dehydrorhamnose reductase [Salinimicrobium gaetbulicola]|uniref:dTDP-4-dehydrorhamnose reductase n=1 Tax=Salinimicrobium gaetbulicola TaxID=999702 RepID=A0ABW3IEQ8_9FLAO